MFFLKTKKKKGCNKSWINPTAVTVKYWGRLSGETLQATMPQPWPPPSKLLSLPKLIRASSLAKVMVLLTWPCPVTAPCFANILIPAQNSLSLPAISRLTQ